MTDGWFEVRAWMTERWLPVVGFESFYEVSDLGRVRNMAREGQRGRAAIHHRMLKNTTQQKKAGGYAVVDLRADGRRKNSKVHIMVLEAFVEPRPEGMQGCHNNGVRTDARLSNLKWATPHDNSLDRYNHGTMFFGDTVKNSKLSADDVRAIRTACESNTQANVAALFGVSQGTISDIVCKRTWNHL